MKALRRFVKRLTASLLGWRDDDRVREELAEHLTLLTEDYARGGLPFDEARRRARLKLGGDEAITERWHDEQRLRLLENTWQDMRYALRQLLRSPGFTLVAVLGLALGIGANVAFFSVVNSVFLRPLPYREPDRLVRLSSTNEAQNLRRVGLSYSRYIAVQEQQRVFSDLALSIGNPFTLTGRGDPEQLVALQASAALLPALGLQPAIGRSFSPAEDAPGGQHVVLISQAMWRQRFDRDPSVLVRR
jgi:hypothetical protein